MAILTSLFSGVSGLNANGKALSVIGNNIANVNTVGFKGSRAVFADILSQSLSGASLSSQIGRGVVLNRILPDFTQGSLETTNSALDLAIEGEGFFLVRDSVGALYYTRAGQFHVNQDGIVVNSDGLALQAYLADASGEISGELGDINLSAATSAPKATERVSITANLDSRVSPITTGFDLSDPNGTSHFSTAITVYDSLGNGHLVTVYFTKVEETTDGNTWQWNAVAEGNTGTSVMARGYLFFNTEGALVSENPPVPPGLPAPFSDFDFPGGATQNQVISFDFGESVEEGGTGLDGTTQFGSASATVFQSQDGFAAGALKSVGVDTDGRITALFTNGQTRVLGQVVLGVFNNPHGLTRMGRNLFAESFESGQPIVGVPDSGGRGKIISNALELSNVDLAEEFIKMIAAQRGFQANSRIITTTDAILEDLVNLKR